MIHKIKSIAFFLVLFGVSSNIFAQKLKVYEDHIDLKKVYQQGTTVYLSENNDIRIYSSSNHQTENSVAINKANPNNVIISTNGRIIYDSNGDFITVHQPYFYTLDGGITWNGSENNPNGISSGGDPVVLFDVSGNAYYVTLGNPSGIYVLKSTNGGATWGNTVNADPLNSSGDDKEHAATDISGTYPNNIYVAWTDFNTNNIVFTRSTNSGASFGNRVILYSGLSQGAHISIGPNGEVYVAFAVYTSSGSAESGIKFTKSTNGGGTFTSANLAFPITGIGYTNNGIPEFNNTRVNSFPSMEVDRSNGSRRGWIYIVYDDKSTGDADIYLRRSTDGGTTWSSAIRVNSDQVGNGKQQWFPSIDIDEITGKIYVSYFNMDATGFLTARYVAISDDGGNTFNCGRISDVRFTPTALGAGYHDGYMGDYYETAVYNSKLYATWSDNREGNFQAYISLGVTAHQFLSNNSTEVGTMGHWENSQFVNYSVPTHFEFSPGETHVLHATYSMFSGEKYNEWDYDNNVKNFRSFDILPNTNEITAKLKPTYSGVSVKNSLENYSLTGGSVQFKDPWYRDYADPSYGNNVRNRGTEAIYHSKSSPFNITTSSAYQGIFLGQNPTFDTQLPIYSVKAESPQTININGANHTFYFQNWAAEPSGSATFNNSNNLETPVVFNNDGATVKAVMKGTQLSNTPNAYSSDSRNKLVRTPNGNLHMVYESMNKIWYEKSTDNGNTWILMNNGNPIGGNYAMYPSIDFVDDDQIIIAYNKIEGGPKIAVTYFLNGVFKYEKIVEASWGNVNDFSEPSVSITYPSRMIVVWDNHNFSSLKYRFGYVGNTYVYWYNSTSNVPNSSSSSKHPTVATSRNYSNPVSYWLAWEENERYIRVYKITTNSYVNTVQFTQYHYFSNTAYTYNREPSISVMSDNNYRIAWIGERTGEKKVVTYFNNQYYKFGWFPTSANISATDDGRNIIAYSDSYGNTNKFAHIWWYTSYNNLNIPGKHVQLCNGSSTSSMYAESFQNSSVPYSFSTSGKLSSLSKSAENKVLSGREAIVTKDSVQFYYVLGDVMVDNNSIEPIEVEKNPDLSKVENANSYLLTEPFNLKDNSDFTFSVIYGVTDSLSAEKDIISNEYVNFKVELAQKSNNKILGEYHNVEFNAKSIVGNKTETFKIDPKGIGSREVYLRLVVNTNLKTHTSIANIHADESILPKGSTKAANDISYKGIEIISDYSLSQNYPNPFNPQTTISYQLPKDGFVTLKVYDALGKEITTLVNNYKQSGRYNVIFDGSNLASGVYFYKITAGKFTDTKKLILVK